MQESFEALADSPTTDDLLGFKQFARPIVRRIITATDKNTSIIIGIHGEWGSGKTSFLMMLAELLREKDVYPIWFNAWKYDQEANLWSALLQTILDQARVSGRPYRRFWVKLKIWWWDKVSLRSGVWEVIRKLAPVFIRTLLFILCISLLLGWKGKEVETFLSKIPVNFSLTEQDLNNLKEDGVPVNIINNFKYMVNKKYKKEGEFLKYVEKSIGQEPTTLYKNKILKYAKNPTIVSLVTKIVLAIIAMVSAKPDILIKLFGSNLGIDFSKMSRRRSYLEHVAFLDEFSREFQHIIRLIGRGKPLVVIIDDLDRCLPEKAVQVLESIKLFLDVQGCVFLLAVDRDVIEKAVILKYKDIIALDWQINSQQVHRTAFLGEKYYEKIIQLPLSLPPLSKVNVKDLISGLCKDYNISSCSDIFAVGLARNPRQVKRILQIFLFLCDFAMERIDAGIIKTILLAKLVIIQNRCPDLYHEIVENPIFLKRMEEFFHQDENNQRLEEENAEIEAKNQELERRIEMYNQQYPYLRDLLLAGLNEINNFYDSDIGEYVFFLSTTIEVEKKEEVRIPFTWWPFNAIPGLPDFPVHVDALPTCDMPYQHHVVPKSQAVSCPHGHVFCRSHNLSLCIICGGRLF